MLGFDMALKRLIVPDGHVDIEIERLRVRSPLRSHTDGDEVWEYLDVIDAKASAMLGHISIFAAVAGLLLTTTDDASQLRLALSIEFVALLFLTFLCLRCLRIIVPTKKETSDDIVYRSAVREMLYRRRIYVFVHEVTGIVTLTMIATAVLKFLT